MKTLNDMIKIASKMEISDLKEQAVKMFNSTEDYAGDVLSALLNALELKIAEVEFIKFCEAM